MISTTNLAKRQASLLTMNQAVLYSILPKIKSRRAVLMTKEEYRQALLNLQEVTAKIRGTPLTEEEIEQMVEEVQKIKSGEISIPPFARE